MKMELQISGQITAIDAALDRDWATVDITREVRPGATRTFSVVVARKALTAALGDSVTAQVRGVNHTSKLADGQLQIDVLFIARSIANH